MTKPKSLAATCFLAAMCQFGCSKDLDRKMVMRLIPSSPVTVGINTVPLANQQAPLYLQAARLGLLSCQDTPNGAYLMVCKPKDGNLFEDSDGMKVRAGSLAVSNVSGIAKEGPDSAVAEVQLVFQPTPFYQQYHGLFEQMNFEAQGQVSNRTLQANFQRYDDGWRFTGYR